VTQEFFAQPPGLGRFKPAGVDHAKKRKEWCRAEFERGQSRRRIERNGEIGLKSESILIEKQPGVEACRVKRRGRQTNSSTGPNWQRSAGIFEN
jgi:hypothetical protein